MKKSGLILPVYVGLVLAFLVLPLVIVIALSFSPSRFFVFPPSGVSLRWYVDLVSAPKWREAAFNSLIVGLGASFVATAVGLLAAWGLSEAKSRWANVATAWLVLPMGVPIVVVAVASFITYSQYGLASTRLGLILAHAALGLPFVTIAVTATLRGFNRNLVRAAESLGASPFAAFRTVTIPVVMPGILTGAIFAFAVSFDEVIVALFQATPQLHTLPVEIFSGTRESITPTVTAAATVLMVISILLLVLVERLRKLSG
ncbi:ABC transporter permease [Aestuariivirga sp. YIM B02566]|uniref:ABC transporter permease n=1 Tax=Taklimakanibacter albus TaxID=2800327 RepID=UPI0032B1055D